MWSEAGRKSRLQPALLWTIFRPSCRSKFWTKSAKLPQGRRLCIWIETSGFWDGQIWLFLGRRWQKAPWTKKEDIFRKMEKILECANAISDTGNLNYMELSIAAKACYILTREGGTATRETIRSVAEKLRWSINKTELNRTINFLDKLHIARWKWVRSAISNA